MKQNVFVNLYWIYSNWLVILPSIANLILNNINNFKLEFGRHYYFVKLNDTNSLLISHHSYFKVSNKNQSSQKHPSLEFSNIQSRYLVTLVYTPGYPGLAQPLPQETTPKIEHYEINL